MIKTRFRQYLFALVSLILLLISSPVLSQTPEHNTYARIVKKGAEQIQAGNYQDARDSFIEALRYNDGDFAAHLGLGISYFHLNEDAYCERELVRAIALNANSSPAYEWLGELYYRKDDLEAAAGYWEKALALNPGSNLKTRLERIRREHRAEKDFNRDVTSHFLIKYEGREKIATGRIILRILEDAYGEIGRSLSFYPDREIQVILYSAEQFREVTDAPGWSGAVYDGKIRIPIGGIEKETPGLRRLLLHEYTHAVVRAVTKFCPTWLNEGLAQYFEGREIDGRQKEALRKIAQSGKIPSLSNLEGSFTGLNGDQAMTVYFFSLSSVRYMIDNFGLYRIKSVLDELAAGADTGKAIDSAISLSYSEFERGWKRSLD